MCISAVLRKEVMMAVPAVGSENNSANRNRTGGGGTVILRGHHSTTSPYGFRGMGEAGLKLLAKARARIWHVYLI